MDRLLDPAKELREAMEALIEKAKDGPPGLWVWRKAGDQEASRLRLAKARHAFTDRLGKMKAAMVDLEDAGYAGAPRPAKTRYIYDRNSPDFLRWALDDGHEPGPAEMGLMYEAVVNSRDSNPGLVVELAGLIRNLEEAMLAARAFCSDAQTPGLESAIALDAEDEKLLAAMAGQPNRLWTIIDLSDQAHVSNKTAGERVNRMIGLGLAHRPRGPRGGVQVLAKGQTLASEARLIRPES
jgi:hypothetical protein